MPVVFAIGSNVLVMKMKKKQKKKTISKYPKTKGKNEQEEKEKRKGGDGAPFSGAAVDPFGGSDGSDATGPGLGYYN